MKEIPLTQGFVALVDDADFESVSLFSWFAVFIGRPSKCDRIPRAGRSIPHKPNQYLHHFLMGAKSIDHRDGNPLNNQRYNLRRATKKQNNRAFRKKTPGTSSRFRGVCWDRSRRKWYASIEVNEIQKFLGRFEKEEDAARAYNKAANRFFGSFAAPNFV